MSDLLTQALWPTGPHKTSPTINASEPLQLLIKGLGHVPSFKNRKRAILDRKTGKPRTLTDPKVQKWMARAVESLVSQFASMPATNGVETWTTKHQRSLIALLLPETDSCKDIIRLEVRFMRVLKGDEGAIILIQQEAA